MKDVSFESYCVSSQPVENIPNLAKVFMWGRLQMFWQAWPFQGSSTRVGLQPFQNAALSGQTTCHQELLWEAPQKQQKALHTLLEKQTQNRSIISGH